MLSEFRQLSVKIKRFHSLFTNKLVQITQYSNYVFVIFVPFGPPFKYLPKWQKHKEKQFSRFCWSRSRLYQRCTVVFNLDSTLEAQNGVNSLRH